MTAAERKKLKHRQSVEGRAARVRLDRVAPKKLAAGGETDSDAGFKNERPSSEPYPGPTGRTDSSPVGGALEDINRALDQAKYFRQRMRAPMQRASGGSVKQQFNSAVHSNPARPTVDEPGPLPAVAARARGGRMRKGWVDGQPAKGEGN